MNISGKRLINVYFTTFSRIVNRFLDSHITEETIDKAKLSVIPEAKQSLEITAYAGEIETHRIERLNEVAAFYFRHIQEDERNLIGLHDHKGI